MQPRTMSWCHGKLMILKKRTLLIVWQHCISDDAKSGGGGKGVEVGGRSIYGLMSLLSELMLGQTPSNILKWVLCGLYKNSGSGEMRLMG